MTICPACNWRPGLDGLQSAIGTAPLCVECFEARAESPVAVHRAVQGANRDPVMELTLKDALRTATIWRGRDAGYIPLAAYHDMMSRQQLVPVTPPPEQELAPEDEELFQQVMEKWRNLSRPHSQKPRWRDTLSQWIFILTGWSPA